MIELRAKVPLHKFQPPREQGTWVVVGAVPLHPVGLRHRASLRPPFRAQDRLIPEGLDGRSWAPPTGLEPAHDPRMSNSLVLSGSFSICQVGLMSQLTTTR
jgi:hypothetical protein